jgi:hypothetical protein
MGNPICDAGGNLLAGVAPSVAATDINNDGKADLVPPETTITGGPSGRVNDPVTTFEFTSSAADPTFRCRVSGGALGSGTWRVCQSPFTTSTLADGSYTFEVYAVDSAGGSDLSPASRTWTVDATAPVVDSTSPAKRATGVARRTNVTATFSEKMDRTSISASTFKLFKCTSKGCTTPMTELTPH